MAPPSSTSTNTGAGAGTGGGTAGSTLTGAGRPSPAGIGVKERIVQKKGVPASESEDERYWKFKQEIQDRLVDTLDAEALKDIKDEAEKTELIKQAIEKLVVEVGADQEVPISGVQHKGMVQDILDEVVGLGPIESLLRDGTISEVMVNGPKQLYVEQGGKLRLTDKKFRDDHHVMHIIHKIVAPIGRHIDESSPMVDARLKDGSRVNAIIPPLALCGPTITIRKFAKEKLTVQDLIRFGTLSEEMADFLAACIKIRLNVVVSGGTGSGKTTTLNILSSFIPSDERIITVEDAAELQLRQEHVVSLETRPPNIEGTGEVTIRDLVRNCLRMRPERIIVGEIRGGEALDMLQAMNTGHDGSLTTGHANSPRDFLARLETMVMMAGMDLPSRAIREQIASAIDLIIQQNRLRDGSRKITHITEVQGMEGDIITLTDIFRFEQTGVDDNGKIIGRLKPTGIRPKFMNRFKEEGIILPAKIFMADAGGF
ncbi:MAG: CpaF family protein [Candidatus Riflebacteria bacterium]|nr:CpaF family protein [Candidatus Riflebacteria bacterium]